MAVRVLLTMTPAVDSLFPWRLRGPHRWKTMIVKHPFALQSTQLNGKETPVREEEEEVQLAKNKFTDLPADPQLFS